MPKKNLTYVNIRLACRIKPAKKTLKKIEELAISYGAQDFEQEFVTTVTNKGKLFLDLTVGWNENEFEEKLLKHFNRALNKLCTASKEFLVDDSTTEKKTMKTVKKVLAKKLTVVSSLSNKSIEAKCDTKEELSYVEGYLPCRITPAAKTIKAIESLAYNHQATDFHSEVVNADGKTYLYLAIGWEETVFTQALLDRFSDALMRLCTDSKEFDL